MRCFALIGFYTDPNYAIIPRPSFVDILCLVYPEIVFREAALYSHGVKVVTAKYLVYYKMVCRTPRPDNVGRETVTLRGLRRF